MNKISASLRGPVSRAAGVVSKISAVSLNRNMAQSIAPAAVPGRGQDRVSAYTFFTSAPIPGQQTTILYNGDRLWTQVTMTLETAGPVAIGQQADLEPVLGGKGQLLATGVPTTLNVAKGDRIYIVASGVNRVKVKIEAYPWLESITGMVARVAALLGGQPT